jgi:hypothetical protein
MKRILSILVVGVILILVGCAKKTMLYQEASSKFRVGISEHDAKKTFGTPTTVLEMNGELIWHYSPIDHLKPPVREAEGFEVIFRDGVTTRLNKHTLVAN